MHPSVPISNATINLTYSLSHETGYNLSSYSSHSIWLIPLSYVRLILYYSNTFCLFLKTECEILESRGCANSCLQPTSHIPTSNSCIILCLVCLIQVIWSTWEFYTWNGTDHHEFPCSHLTYFIDKIYEAPKSLINWSEFHKFKQTRIWTIKMILT